MSIPTLPNKLPAFAAEDRGQMAFELGHTPSLAEADFTVGEGNRVPLGHLRAYPNWPSPLALLVGPPKSGKSHLARIWAERAGARVVGPDQIEAVARAGGMTPLVIEDVDRLTYDEEALFHVLNQSMRDHRAVLMTSREPVANWAYRTDDLLSQARLATHLLVTPPGDMELSQMFVKLFGDRQVVVDPRIVSYVVPRMERSPEEVVAMADLMDRMALARGTAITRSIAAEALAQRALARGEGVRDFDLGTDDDE